MAIQIIGSGGAIADVDGTVYNALKVTPRPTEYGLKGTYRLSVATGTINATLTSGSIFQFYWPSPVAVALVWGVMVDYSGSSANAGLQRFELAFERSVSAYGSGGTLVVVPGTTGESQQLRTSMRSSWAAPVRIATTAALTNGTWVEDANSIGSFTFAVDNSGVNRNPCMQVRLYGSLERHNGAPLVLAQNEALNVALTTVTTPTFVAAVTVVWSEVGAY
jgi:hypothetical protein